MSENLEAILLRLGLDASGFTKGARDAKKEMTGLEKGVSSLKGEMASLAAQAAAGFGVAVLVKEALEFAEAVTKVHEQTGLSIQSIQFLRLAADQTGVSVDALAGTVNKLQRQLVAAGENDKLRAQIEDITGPIVELRALAPEEQLQKVAESIAAISDPAERTAAAVTLLGKSGAESIPELIALAEHSDELNEAFVRTGGAVSEEAIAKVEAFGDAIGETKTSVVALATELVAVAAPSLTSFLRTVTEVVGGLRLLDGEGDNAAVNLSNKIDEAEAKLEVMRRVADSMFSSDAAKDAVYAQEELIRKMRERLDVIHGVGAAGMEAARIEREANAISLALLDEGAAALTASLSNELAIQANFAGIRFEQTAAEMDAETQLRIEMLRQRHELERAEEEAQAQFLKDISAGVDAHVAEGVEAASGLKITTWQQETSSIASLLQQQTEGVARHSKAAFEINKAAGIVTTTINTIEAVVKAWKDYGWPVGAAVGAAIAVAGAAQVQAIAATQFGSRTAPSQAAAPATPTAPAGGGAGGGGGAERVVRVEGLNPEALFTGNTVRAIADKLLDLQADGGKVIFQ